METTLKLSHFGPPAAYAFKEKNFSQAAYLVFGAMLLLWLILPGVIRQFDPTSGGVDPAIWLLILLSLLAFLMLTRLVLVAAGQILECFGLTPPAADGFTL